MHIQYSLNTLWINSRKIVGDDRYLYDQGETPLKRLENFNNKIVNPLIDWSKLNPNATTNLWYDADRICSSVIVNSESVIQKALDENSCQKNIFLKDIRVLEIFKNEPLLFKDKPLFWVIDYLKNCILLHAWENENLRYCVNMDLDVAPLSEQELFDSSTIQSLDKFGFVMAAAGAFLHYENSFQIFDCRNIWLKKCVKKVLIDMNAQYAIRKGIKLVEEDCIYGTYRCMFAYLLLKDEEERIPIKYFRRDYFAHFYEFISDEDRLKIKNICDENNVKHLKYMIPVKKVEVPPSHFFLVRE